MTCPSLSRQLLFIPAPQTCGCSQNAPCTSSPPSSGSSRCEEQGQGTAAGCGAAMRLPLLRMPRLAMPFMPLLHRVPTECNHPPRSQIDVACHTSGWQEAGRDGGGVPARAPPMPPITPARLLRPQRRLPLAFLSFSRRAEGTQRGAGAAQWSGSSTRARMQRRPRKPRASATLPCAPQCSPASASPLRFQHAA